MSSRRTLIGLITTIAALFLAVPRGAEAQPAAKVHRVGVLWPPSAGASGHPISDAFYQGLRDLGWIEGRNVVIEVRRPRQYEQLPELAAELVRMKVDVIVAGAGPASLKAAREATKTIPIVMIASSSDPIGAGLIQSFARPGGNITGLTTAPTALEAKRLQLLKEAVPRLSRVGFLWDRNIGPARLEFLSEPARSLKVELLPFEVREPGDLESAVGAAMKERAGGVIVAGTPMFLLHGAKIADLLAKHRLPAISGWRSTAEAGLLMTYGPSVTELFRQAAAYVDKILRGTKPGELPVEQPSKFELVLNLKTAKVLGLTIPPSLLLQADHVIE